jgi:cytidine deaminase
MAEPPRPPPPPGPDALRLIEAARAVRRHAYAPYSGFAVGAAVQDEAGRTHVGVNVENAAYPLGLCAEAGAIAAMVAAGGRRLRAVAVVGVSADPARPVMPCGGCRQKLREFGGSDLELWFADEQQVTARRTLGQLLPDGFGPQDLGERKGSS